MLERVFSFKSRAVLRYSSLIDTAKAGFEFVKKYPVDKISKKARFGAEAMYLLDELDEYGKALFGARERSRGGLRDTLHIRVIRHV